MTDWGRDLERLWKQTKYLKSYAEINKRALKHAGKIFINHAFVFGDNSFDKQIASIINCKSFKNS
jgi:hypothetical protein